MTQSTKTILRFGRGTVIAAAIVGMSGLLEAAGLPTVSGIVQNLGAAQSEARRLRDKAARASATRDWQSPCMSEELAPRACLGDIKA